ncbi:MAG: hypothetical protein WBO47_07850 [Gammaproteobacteria bacterium]
MRRVVMMLGALLLASTAVGDDLQNKAILDFAQVPAKLAPARLAVLDGHNITAPPSQTSFWVDPGEHEIVVTAIIEDSMELMGGIVNEHVGPGDDPGKTSITVEAGKRYRIAAEVLNNMGKWQPVVWKVEDAED